MPKQSPQKQITQYYTPDHDPDDNNKEADDVDSVEDPSFNPSAHEVIEVLDADADDDNDGNISPKMPPSKKHKERESNLKKRKF